MSFYKQICISNIPANNDTLRLFKEKMFMRVNKGMGESASFVSGSSHHFPEKYRKLEKTLESLFVSFLFVIFASVNISILKIKADIMDKYHYNDR